jgi:hypothetical protein
MTAGSVLNDSTVYVGKYLTDELYFDVLAHFLYDESRILENPNASGMGIQPEIGLEISAPFATLRWSFSPEFYSWDDFASPSLWVSAASITVSQKWTGEEVRQFFKELF